MQVIPAIDIINGQCVRLSQGDYSSAKIYQSDPLLVAQDFEKRGFERLHIVDLDGAKSGSVVNFEVLEKIKKHTTLKVDFGGGIKTTEDLEKVLATGVEYAVIGSLAIKNPQLFWQWVEQYQQKIVLMLDVKDEKIATMGWQTTTDINIFDYLDEYSPLLKLVFCTDVNKDGMLNGPNFDLYKRLIERYPNTKFVASGGVSSIADLKQLASIGLDGAIVGKAIYEGYVNLDELSSTY